MDLASVALDVLSWGGDPRALAWFESPPPGALDAALALLARLGAVDASGALTSIGRALRRIPLHPRLGRMLLAGRAAPAIARACALLSERHLVPPRHGATACDLLSAVDREQALPGHVRRVARDLVDVARGAIDGPVTTDLHGRGVPPSGPRRLSRSSRTEAGARERSVRVGFRDRRAPGPGERRGRRRVRRGGRCHQRQSGQGRRSVDSTGDRDRTGVDCADVQSVCGTSSMRPADRCGPPESTPTTRSSWPSTPSPRIRSRLARSWRWSTSGAARRKATRRC